MQGGSHLCLREEKAGLELRLRGEGLQDHPPHLPLHHPTPAAAVLETVARIMTMLEDMAARAPVALHGVADTGLAAVILVMTLIVVDVVTENGGHADRTEQGAVVAIPNPGTGAEAETDTVTLGQEIRVQLVVYLTSKTLLKDSSLE